MYQSQMYVRQKAFCIIVHNLLQTSFSVLDDRLHDDNAKQQKLINVGSDFARWLSNEN
jgi:hypothetical protein